MEAHCLREGGLRLALVQACGDPLSERRIPEPVAEKQGALQPPSRHGETISTAFVESTVNQVVSKRFVKKQQMRWTARGAHRLLQIRTKVLNEDWYGTLRRWHSAMAAEPEERAA